MKKKTAGQLDNLLSAARKSWSGEVRGLPTNPELRSQCIRIGLSVGERFTCIERLPGGTIVVQAHRQEIAIGKNLAKEIDVEFD
ncbi:MAG: ferrous iron transport protein A [Ignavibacteriae bacterium]|nr:ferrous iron transport protein A [Ignavibacteriota bacterium]MCB9217350.1 ferrous iron transport protein A [Ignavibacteria bacterium]